MATATGLTNHERNMRNTQPNRFFTSLVQKMYGVFDKGELSFVEWTFEEATKVAHKISQKDNTKERPTLHRFQVAEVFVITSSLNNLWLSDARVVLEEATHEWLLAKNKEAKLVAAVIEEKGTMPENYWEPRHKAWLKMEAARRIVEAFENGGVG